MKTPKVIIRLTVPDPSDPRCAGDTQVCASRVFHPHYFNGDLAVRGHDQASVLKECARRCRRNGTPVTHYVVCQNLFGIVDVSENTIKPLI